MPAIKMYRIVMILPALVLLGFLCGCAAQTAEMQTPTQIGETQTQTQYSNPGRPEVYSADESGYEKPWPFGDLENNPQ